MIVKPVAEPVPVFTPVSALRSDPDDTHYATATTYDAVGNVASVTHAEGNTTRCA